MRVADLRPLLGGWWFLQSRTYATNSGLLRADDGEIALVDPGIAPDEIAVLHAFATQQGRPHYLILTHAHWDHLLGAAAFPHATIVARRPYTGIIEAHADDLRRQVARWAASQHRAAPDFTPPRPTLAFAEALKLHVGCHTLHLLATPGHSADHLSLFDAGTGLLWAGDMLSDRELPCVQHDADAYLVSLQRLRALQAEYLVPGHGAVAESQAAIAARFERDIDYLHHLIGCVDEALQAGSDLAATLERCDFPLPLDDVANREAHRWNVESRYAQRAAHFGLPVPAEALGWQREWRGEAIPDVA